MMLPLKLIRRDGGTQPRVAMDLETVERYAHDLREGIAFAPIEVVYDGTNYWCWDGFHRCAAAANAGVASISATARTVRNRSMLLPPLRGGAGATLWS